MDSLRRRVLARDAKNNSSRQMQATDRGQVWKTICPSCRRVPDWQAAAQARSPRQEIDMTKCQACGDRLVSVLS